MAKITLKGLFTRARTAAPAPVAEVETDMEAALQELRNAERAVISADANYSAALLTADDAGLKALDDARHEAARRMDRAQALMSALDERLTSAREVEAKAELARIVEAATAAQAAFREAVERDLPDMAARARAILALRLDAERATVAANRALADAGERGSLPGVEAFRTLPGRPREELRRETVDRWVDDTGNLAGHQEKIAVGSDGAGSLRLPNASYLRRFTMKRSFEVIEFLPAEPGAQPASLLDALQVPEVYGVAHHSSDRRLQTETRPVGPVRVVTKAEPSRLDRMAMGHRA